MFNLPAGTYKLSVCKNGSFAIYNENGKLIHSKYSNGLELWYEYDTNGNQIHHKNSRGFEIWKEYDTMVIVSMPSCLMDLKYGMNMMPRVIVFIIIVLMGMKHGSMPMVSVSPRKNLTESMLRVQGR